MARFYEDESTPWYNPRYWRKRIWAGVITVIIIIVVVVAVVVVEVRKQDKYPNYTKLTYKLSDTCELQRGGFLNHTQLTILQTLERLSLINLITLQIMIQVRCHV
jgi:hypothetical protein